MLEQVKRASLTSIGSGRIATVYALDEQFAIKIFREGVSQADVLAEFQGTRLAEQCGIKVPTITEMGVVEGHHALLMQRLHGSDMMTSFLDGMKNGEALNKTLSTFAKVHQSLLAIHAPTAPDCKNRLRYQLKHGGFHHLIKALDALPDGNQFCHGDFHPGNLLLCDGVPYVIDCMTVAKGIPILDIARTFALLSISLRGEMRAEHLDAVGMQYLQAMQVERAEVESVLPMIVAARLEESPRPGEQAYIVQYLRNRGI